MKRFVDKDKAYHIKYESISEFFELTDPNKPPADMHPSNKENHREITSRGDGDWRYGDEENRDTYLKTRFDNTKGKSICAEAVRETFNSKEFKKLIAQAMTFKKRIAYDDSGSRIDVPRAIGGEEKYFVIRKNAKRPTVRIAINICGSACVEKEQFIKLAKTAIPTIYALEMAGICTEVYYCGFSKNTYTTSEFSGGDETSVLIKSAQQRFNWTTFAPVFTLGSYRESMFLSWIYSPYKVSGGLGQPMGDKDLEKRNNFGYDCVIGFNAPGPVEQTTKIFNKIQSIH